MNLAAKVQMFYRDGISYLRGAAKVAGPPVHVFIEVTNLCNYRCTYCPQSTPEEHFKTLGRGSMSMETFRSILDKLTSAWKIERLILYRDGEPLVHQQLEEFVRHARTKVNFVAFSSNGALISEERADALIRSGLSQMKGDLCVDRNLYEALRVGGKYDEALRGYRNILKAAKRHNARFLLGILDLASYRMKSRAKAERSQQELRALFAGFEPWLSIGSSVMHNALGEAKEILRHKSPPGRRHYNRCHHPWFEMVIDHKGNVVGCCRDLRSEYLVGNILGPDNPEMLWNGDGMQHLRRSLARKQPYAVPTCNKCDLPYGESFAGSNLREKLVTFLRLK